MRLALVALLALAACAQPEPLRYESVMPVEQPTDTLRAEFTRAEFDTATGVLRLAGRVLSQGPQTSGWTEAVGATLTLRPPDQTEGGRIPLLMRKPFVTVSAGLEGAFDFGAVTPDPTGYTFDAQWVGAFGLTLSVDSLLASR